MTKKINRQSQFYLIPAKRGKQPKFFLIRLFLYFAFSLFFIFFSPPVFSQDFETDYQVYYYLNQTQPDLVTVDFKIKVNHRRSDIRLKKFSLSFQSFFAIDQLVAYLNNQPIDTQINNDGRLITITVEIPDNFFVNKESSYDVNLKFIQKNLGSINGNIYELILPTVSNVDNFKYRAIVILPNSFNRKISLAKPKPTVISNNQIIWDNPKVKTIYATFGDKQIYKTQIYYRLKNDRFIPIYTEVAFPPDTLYQQIFINQIVPEPITTYSDEDGNLIGKYLLKPKEDRSILFDGKIVVFSQPRDEIKTLIRQKIKTQERYLLRESNDWQIDNIERFSNLKEINDIYYYIVNEFKYDYTRLAKKTSRVGANIALNEKTGVCTEFTDSFIALAREKGFFAREIQGFGFTAEPQLRPITLSSDILHSWPEFFDRRINLWIPIDPTWENTSGIDYFNSFDFNHIVFAIHGKESRYPVPAGAYKTTNSKDVLIDAINIEPLAKINLNISLNKINNKLFANQKNRFTLTVENKSNVYLYQQKILIETKNNVLKINPSVVYYNSLLPLEQKIVDITIFATDVHRKTTDTLIIKTNDKINKQFTIYILPKLNKLIIGLIIVNIVLFVFLIMILYARRKRD